MGKYLEREINKKSVEIGDTVSIKKQSKQTEKGKINNWDIGTIDKQTIKPMSVRERIEAQKRANALLKPQTRVHPNTLPNSQEQSQPSLKSALDKIIQNKKDNEKQKSNKNRAQDY